MAIGTPVAIGTNSGADVATLTTSGSAPVSSRVFICVGWVGASGVAKTLDSVSGGGLTWDVDFQQPFSGLAEWGFGIASADAPAGLASSTVITPAYSGILTASMIAGTYCTGIATSLPVDVTDGQGQSAATNWDTTATTTTFSDTLVLGGCIHDGLTTNTATGGASELHDFQYAGEAWSMAVEYQILSGLVSASLTGTWASGANNNTSAFVAYKGIAEAPTGVSNRFLTRHSRMTSW